MKRILTLLTAIFFVFSLNGQNIEKLGADKSADLNEDESLYLNTTLSKKRGDFDFKDKKIGFFTGSNTKLWSKQDYFNIVKMTFNESQHLTMQDQLLILNEKEKKDSGGYDALIISRSKILVTEGKKKKLISKIKRR